MSDPVMLHVEEHSTLGRPVVLIHGWPLSSAAWEHQIDALTEEGYQVIAYDRRGFGKSDKPGTGFDYDTLAEDLSRLMDDRDLRDVTLVGFSMGGGEVARYVGNHGQDRLRSVVFAAAVPPFLMQGEDNPDGPLTQEAADEFERALKSDRDAFFDDFTRQFFSAGDALKVSEEERQKALSLCKQSSEAAALGCMQAWATTDFREDLKKIKVPSLVLHGDADGIVPIEGSGQRTHEMVAGSQMHVIEGAPHGCNVSHAQDFNTALVSFLKETDKSPLPV